MAGREPKRVLVTGGAGFVGSHLCDRLLSDGYEVVCVDNFYTGSELNIAHLRGDRRFTFVLHDITVPFAMEVDEIYNLACPASPVHYQRNSLQTLKTCVLGAINVLELAKANGARVLQASTSEVYGDPHVHPQPEDYWGNVNPVGIRSCYDEGKRCAETLFSDYHRQHGIPVRIARIFNTYGPRMDAHDGRVVSNFIVQALKGQEITVYGEGLQTRSFQYVSDLVEGLVRLMAYDGESAERPVNLGRPVEFTISELAQLVIKLIPATGSRISHHPLPGDDPKQRRPDIARAQGLLRWTPEVELESGLRKTIAYFQASDRLGTSR